MPPKEEPKKKKGPPELTEAELDELILKTQLRLGALKAETVERMEQVQAAKREELELRAKCTALEAAFAEVQQTQFDVVCDFTRQHKCTEDELIQRITALDVQVTGLNDQKELAALTLSETIKEKDHYIALKQRELEDQEHKMRDMETEFVKMINETQARMAEKVENTLQRQMAEESVALDNDTEPKLEEPAAEGPTTAHADAIPA